MPKNKPELVPEPVPERNQAADRLPEAQPCPEAGAALKVRRAGLSRAEHQHFAQGVLIMLEGAREMRQEVTAKLGKSTAPARRIGYLVQDLENLRGDMNAYWFSHGHSNDGKTPYYPAPAAGGGDNGTDAEAAESG